MAGLNKAILIGNLGRDPEVRYTSDGRAVTSFSIATSEEWKDRETGEKRQRTEWHRIVAFNKLGEICGEYLSKGRQVYIEGQIRTRDWEDRDGNKRYTTEIIANNMIMLGSRGGVSEAQSSTGQADTDPGYPESASSYAEKPDDDIPF